MKFTDEDPTDDLVVVRPDGGGATTIFESSRGLWGLAWSPDGKRIAVTEARPRPTDRDVASRWSLLVLDSDGTDRATVATFTSFLPTPDWSPDGERLVVPRFDGSSLQLYVMNADGSGAHAITRFRRAYVNDPSWSPDGRRIAFTHGPMNGDDARFRVYVVNADGSGLRRLVDLRRASWPDWSADGDRILLVAARGIYSIRPDGSDLTLLVEDESAADSRPAWSPDGTNMVFKTERWAVPPPPGSTTAAPPWSLAIAKADGTCPTGIPNTRGGFSPDWHGDPEGETPVTLRC